MFSKLTNDSERNCVGVLEKTFSDTRNECDV